MGTIQDQFLDMFKLAFTQRFGVQMQWQGGQTLGNFAGLPGIFDLRREGRIKPNERFEIGDIRSDISGITLVVEFDGSGVSVSNLLKYWPYVKGHLSIQPEFPIVLCNFSNWSSYGSYRDLWSWLLERIQADQEKIVDLHGHQFDHCETDLDKRTQSIHRALD